jgi:uncharacterized protein YerC
MNRQQIMVVTLDQKLQCLKLRKTGMTYEDIATTVGLNSKVVAFRAVKTALKFTLKEPAEAVRSMEVERLNVMLKAIWAMVENGHLGAIDRALKIIDARAKLLGLNAPQEVNFGFGKMTNDQLADYIKTTITEISTTGTGSKKEENQGPIITIE